MIRLVMTVLLLSITLTACGVKGDLYIPEHDQATNEPAKSPNP